MCSSDLEFVAKLRRLVDALEAGERFEIQVAGERVHVPARAEFNVEHEREEDEEEIESNSSGPTPPQPVPTRHADSQIPRERHGRRSLLAIAGRFRSSMRGRVGIWHGAHCTSEYELPWEDPLTAENITHPTAPYLIVLGYEGIIGGQERPIALRGHIRGGVFAVKGARHGH